MESPVRLCLGAALVVTLLLSSTLVNGDALPESTSTTVKDERLTRFSRTNNTYLLRKSKTPDVELNELHPKDSVSEEHTDKNAKYKDRGRVRFGANKSTTPTTLRRLRVTTSEGTTLASKLIIVTPTPEVKRPAQIIDSMRTYKKTKMPSSSSTTSLPVSSKPDESEEESEEDEGDDKGSLEKFTKGYNDNFFTIPNYNDDSQNSEGSENKLKSVDFDGKRPSYSSYFPDTSYKISHDNGPYKAESFFDFSSDLTTPKNDFFDKKYEKISQSIIKNVESTITKSTPTNATNIHKVLRDNAAVNRQGNGTPSNKSTVIFKNTKEIRLSDNAHAGSSKKELSDVHGTSIYYEMSVLSTETYNINNSNEDDCDNETNPSEPTPSTSSDEELASLKGTSMDAPVSTTPSIFDSKPESASTFSTNYLPVSSVDPLYFSSIGNIPYSTQNTLSSTERTRSSSSSSSRSRIYSKRLNVSGSKDTNNVTPKAEYTRPVQYYRNPTRKFYQTTPKAKPVWMNIKRNVTRTSYPRSTTPTTIYSEYFDIKDKLSTAAPVHPSRTTLTTVSSDIDPVLQSDVGGVKKVVHSQSISDNSIPTLWKRGSTKFTTSTAASSETGSGVSDLEIPPTLTAWALASLISPPSLGNNTGSTQKSVDENELQKVGEVTEKKEQITSLPAHTTPLNNDVIPKKIVDIDQNRLPWRQGSAAGDNSDSKPATSSTDSKSESLPAESNISLQSSSESVSNAEKDESENDNKVNKDKQEKDKSWVSATAEDNQMTTEESSEIPPVDATKSTGFESITKLPADLTTPLDDTPKTETATEETKVTTDYEITTIRFSYVPTESNEWVPKSTTPSSWHPVYPTRTKATTIKDEPVTTYRPKYATTTDKVEEITTIVPDTTPHVESTSSSIETSASTEIESEMNEMSVSTTTMKPVTETKSSDQETSTHKSAETTMTSIEVVTEINTEKEPSKSSSTEVMTSTETTEIPSSVSETHESSSEENSGSNEVITQETTKITTPTTTARIETTPKATTEVKVETTESVEPTETNKAPTDINKDQVTTQEAKTLETTVKEETSGDDTSTERNGSSEGAAGSSDDVRSSEDDVTTEASSIVLTEEAGSGAAIAIAVSTIGVIALILLIGLLLVVRRRGRRGVYAQRCTPVSLDAYSLDSVSVGHRKGNHRLRSSKRSYGNPAYDDEVTSHPMQYPALANFALDVELMSNEFSEIPSVTVRPDEVPPGCEDKNRYSNILPLPDTRVPLKKIGSDPTSEYINANFITGPGNIRNYYIACQAPLPNTVIDFWRMIWEHNSRVIVMLTEYMENGVEKCYEYLPPSEISDNKRTFGEYQIVLVKREQRDKYAISSIQLMNVNTRTWREITHLWYFWPAKGVPEDYDSVLDFLSEMRSYMKISQTAKEYDDEGVEVIYGDQSRSSFHNLSKLREDAGSGNGVNMYSPSRAEEQMRRHVTNGTLGRMKAAAEVEAIRPCTVVCASGAGRSAAVIAADLCARALAAGAADVPRVVRELRAQRPHSLANRHHYIFLYKLLSEYGNKLMGGGVDTI